jgi:hypothetical protein
MWRCGLRAVRARLGCDTVYLTFWLCFLALFTFENLSTCSRSQ